MPAWLDIPGHAPSECTAYTAHVHTDLTRSPGRGEPRVPGRSRHEDLVITRRLDHLSPHLQRWCAGGERVAEMVLRVERPAPAVDVAAPPEASGAVDPSDEAPAAEGSSPDDAGPPPPPPQPWFTFVLTDVLVTSVLSSFGDEGPLETVHLSYGEVAWTFLAGEAPQTTSWAVYERSS